MWRINKYVKFTSVKFTAEKCKEVLLFHSGGYVVHTADINNKFCRHDKDGSIKGVSWLACPGCFIYRADLADSLLGIESPEEMQRNIGSWEGFLATAKKINRKSGGKTKIISSNDEIRYVFHANKMKPWVTSEGTLRIDPEMEEYMTVYRNWRRRIRLKNPYMKKAW